MNYAERIKELAILFKNKQSECESLKAKLAIAKEALEEYAKPWIWSCDGPFCDGCWKDIKGKVAEEALKLLED